MVIQKFAFTILLGVALTFTAFAQQEPAHFGEEISEKGALLPADFLKTMDGKTETETKVKAKITNVCQMKGCWMTLDMGNGEEVMVRFKDYGFFVPKDAAGKTAVVKGKAFIDNISVETLRHYAEDAGKSKEEINAITEPEQRLSFTAEGVIIQE